MKIVSTFLCTLTLSGFAGQSPIFPDIARHENIPDLKSVVGFDFGMGITMHHEVMAYARALAESSPRVHLELRGKTWEGRQMGLLIITSEANHARLEQIREQYNRIADPRKTSREELAEIVKGLPTMVLLQQSVHGNEISGTDSGLYLAWHLASAKDNDEINRILENSVLAMELMQNPDGRDRFISYSRQTRSPLGDPDKQAAERDEPWPGGRFNHYLFDMNRDWFAMTQLETQTKVATFIKWHPQVVVDLHEMGSEMSFFAAQPSPPANPLLSTEMLAEYERYGRAIGKAFDGRGWDYFHGEFFDSFYPGYGESWPSLQGAMGVLFEQGSARGLRYQRRNGDMLHHREAVAGQAVGSYAVLQLAAADPARMLNFYYENRARAVEMKDGDRQVFLLADKDPARTVALGRLLQAQGIEVEQIQEPIKGISGRESVTESPKKREIPAGSLLVRFNQPAGLLARSLLMDRLELDPEFMKQQQARYERLGQNPDLYDITGWSLPLMYGVTAVMVPGSGWKDSGSIELKVPTSFENQSATLGFIMPDSFGAGAALAEMLRNNLKVSYTTQEIEHEGRIFPRGSLIVKRANNPDDLVSQLKGLVDKYEISMVGVNTSWFERGPSFGSDAVKFINKPRVAMIWNQPTAPMSAGWMRYIMEQRLGYPVTALRGENLARFQLQDYDVILLPEGYGYGSTLGGGTDKLKRWVADGGVLVAVGNATDWLSSEAMGLLETQREWRDGSVSNDDKDIKPPKQAEKEPEDMIKPLQERPRPAHGALLKVAFDTLHWSCFGVNEQQAVLVDSSRVLRPVRQDEGHNAGRFVDREELLRAGYIPNETLDRLAHKTFMMVSGSGRGLVIAFSEDLNYRAFQRGLEPLMRNAIFFAPAMTRQ